MNALDKAVRAASRANRPIALDTQILIGHMEQREEVAPLVSAFIADPTVLKILSTVTVAEILTLPATRETEEHVLVICEAIYRIPGLRVVDLGRDVAVTTATVRARTGLRLPDAAVIATAIVSDAFAVVGNDARWKPKSLGIPYIHLDDLRA